MMAPPETLPSAPTEDFEPPPDDDEAITNPKEVPWSATPKENEQETIEKRKIPVRYEISCQTVCLLAIRQYSMCNTKDSLF
jgi:hypothetical protein